MSKQIKVAKTTPRQRRNRDAEMMRAALQLFAQKGYAAASMQDLAVAIGVLKGSVYHYIGSKEDLLFRIFQDAHLESEALMQEVTALIAEPKERLRIYLHRSLLVSLNNLERTSLYFRDWRQLTGERRETLVRHRAEYDHFLWRLIKAVYESEGIEDHIDIKHVSSFVIGGVNWVANWFRPAGPDLAESIAKDYTMLAMAAILGGRRNIKPLPRLRAKR